MHTITTTPQLIHYPGGVFLTNAGTADVYYCVRRTLSPGTTAALAAAGADRLAPGEQAYVDAPTWFAIGADAGAGSVSVTAAQVGYRFAVLNEDGYVPSPIVPAQETSATIASMLGQAGELVSVVREDGSVDLRVMDGSTAGGSRLAYAGTSDQWASTAASLSGRAEVGDTLVLEQWDEDLEEYVAVQRYQIVSDGDGLRQEEGYFAVDIQGNASAANDAVDIAASIVADTTSTWTAAALGDRVGIRRKASGTASVAQRWTVTGANLAGGGVAAGQRSGQQRLFTARRAIDAGNVTSGVAAFYVGIPLTTSMPVILGLMSSARANVAHAMSWAPGGSGTSEAAKWLIVSKGTTTWESAQILQVMVIVND